MNGVVARAAPARARRPRPFGDCPAAELAAMQGVLTDIDDTLTRDGVIEPAALAALHALHDAGVPVVAVTGRPLGWSEAMARAWPVAAIVAENGAAAWLREGTGVGCEFVDEPPTRASNALRLRAVAERVLREVPQARLARDSAGRATDIAIDHAEFAHLDAPSVARVVAVMRSGGLNASVSSIHVNGWIGAHSKWTGARWMLRRLWGRDLEAEAARWLYVGDSTNDEVMFERLPLTVGVANLLRFEAELRCWPRYLAAGERGAGFAEVARALLARPPASGAC